MRGRWHLTGWVGLLLVAAVHPVAAQPGRAPAPEVEIVTTDDGIQLALTYYASWEGKEATPVVLLHDHKDTRSIFGSLALRLQSPGENDNHPSFAVVTVDLRGHGGSTRRDLPNGDREQIDAARLDKELLVGMVQYDMKAVRQFLVTKNDEGKLNLNKLCLVGAGMGGNVAATWGAVDWAWPPLAVGKQGQDVKGVVLISPSWKFHGLLMQNALRLADFNRNAAWLIICGVPETRDREAARAQADAARIFKQLERFHPAPPSTRAQQARRLQGVEWDSSLQGGNLLSQVGGPLEDAIIDFLTANVADKEFLWIQRRGRAD